MHVMNIHETKTHFSQVLNRVIAGEKVVIGKAGKPVAVLVPYQEKPFQRKGGQLKGILEITDDFDKPLPDDIMRAFKGES